MIEIIEKHQIKLYLIAFFIGSMLGLFMVPQSMSMEKAIEPAIGILLYSMFCQIPFQQLFERFA